MKNVIATLRPLLAVLPPGSRRFLLTYGALTAALALLDLLALGIVGILLQSVVAGTDVTLPLIGSLESSSSRIIALVAVCVIIIAKGVFAVLLLRFATRRFAKHEVAIGDRLFDAYMSSPWQDRLAKNSTESSGRSTSVSARPSPVS